jgi:hypothetical protein
MLENTVKTKVPHRRPTVLDVSKENTRTKLQQVIQRIAKFAQLGIPKQKMPRPIVFHAFLLSTKTWRVNQNANPVLLIPTRMQKNSEDHARHAPKVGFQLTAARHVPRAPLVGLEKQKAQIAKHARMGGIQKRQEKSNANRALQLQSLKTQEPNV